MTNSTCSSGWKPKQNLAGSEVPPVSSSPKGQVGALSKQERADIRTKIQEKFSSVAQASPKGFFSYPTGEAGLRLHSYHKALYQDLPEDIIDSFCGVGNPFKTGKIEGNSLLDIGCGSGLDMIIANTALGETARICGVDINPDMVRLANSNFSRLSLKNCHALVLEAQGLPFAENTFDRVISNGVFNLSLQKHTLFSEIFRVLKPQGVLQFADIILRQKLPTEMKGAAAWSNWIGGAVSVGDQIEYMLEAGFEAICYVGATGVNTSEYTAGALFSARAEKWLVGWDFITEEW